MKKKMNNNKQSLSSKQVRAIHLLALGLTDAKVAEQIGISRQTVNKWKNHDDEFFFELEKQRTIIWDQYKDYYSNLLF